VCSWYRAWSRPPTRVAARGYPRGVLGSQRRERRRTPEARELPRLVYQALFASIDGPVSLFGAQVVAGEEDSLGDVSTLADPSVVDAIIAKVKAIQKR